MINSLKSAFSRITGPKRRKQTRLSTEPAEALEEKILPAGNVLVSLSGSGNLTLKGDNFNNAVRVDPIAGGIQVSGLNDLNGVPTTVNGQTAAVFLGTTFLRGNLKVQLKGGDDDFISTVSVEKNVNVNMGSGSDVLTMVNQTVGGNAKINMGSTGNILEDVTNVANVTVDGNAVIKGSKGSHIVDIDNSLIRRKLTVNLGADDDILDIANSGGASLKANGGSGVDTFILSPGGGGSLPSKGFELFG